MTNTPQKSPLMTTLKWGGIVLFAVGVFVVSGIWYAVPHITQQALQYGKIPSQSKNQTAPKTQPPSAILPYWDSVASVRTIVQSAKSTLAKQGYLINYEIGQVQRYGFAILPTITLHNLHIHSTTTNTTTRAGTVTITPTMALDTVVLTVHVHPITTTKTVGGKSATITIANSTATVTIPWQNWFSNPPVFTPVLTVAKRQSDGILNVSNKSHPLFSTINSHATLYAKTPHTLAKHLTRGDVTTAWHEWVHQGGYMQIADLAVRQQNWGISYQGRLGMQALGTARGTLTVHNYESAVNHAIQQGLVTTDMKLTLNLGAVLLGGKPTGADDMAFNVHSNGTTLTLGTLPIDLPALWNKINSRIAR